MKCPDCKSELLREQNQDGYDLTDRSGWSFFRCPVRSYYDYEGFADYEHVHPHDDVHHYRAIYQDDMLINEVWNLERYCIDISYVSKAYLTRGIDIQLIVPVESMIARCYGGNPIEEPAMGVEYEDLLHLDDPEIFRNKSPEEMERKIRTYLTFQ